MDDRADGRRTGYHVSVTIGMCLVLRQYWHNQDSIGTKHRKMVYEAMFIFLPSTFLVVVLSLDVTFICKHKSHILEL